MRPLAGVMIREIQGIPLPFEYSGLVWPIVLAWHIAAELGSIVENARKLGAPVPKFLVKAIQTLHTSAGQVGEQAVPTEKEKE